LPGWAEGLAKFCQRLPSGWLGTRLAFLLRKPVLALHRPVVDIPVQGVRFRLYPDSNLSDKRLLCTPSMLDGVERRMLAPVIPQNGWLVDIGANIGGFGLLLAAARPDLRVLCVEPDPDMAARLKANIGFNNLAPRVLVEESAVTAEPGEVQLYRDSRNRGQNSLLAVAEADRDDVITVPAKPLLALLDEYAIARPAVLKLDIEGFEHAVLEGFFEEAPASRWPQFIQLEQRRKTELNAAVQLVMRQGYAVRLRSRMNVVLENAAV
jgi:FkbM family methyltransferase